MKNKNNLQYALIKNRVLDNSSNRINKIHFDRFSGESLIALSTGGYLNNGYLYIDVKTNSLLEIYYKNILIFSSSITAQKMIPCLFESDTSLTIKGESDSLTILVFGSEIVDDIGSYFLPMNNKLVRAIGEDYQVLGYSSLLNIFDNSFTLEKTINKLIDIQSFSFNDVLYYGYLYFDNGLYFTSNIDNYANKYIIIDNCIDATIVPDVVSQSIYIFYIKQNKLYYKVISQDMVVGDEIECKITFDDMLSGFANISIKSFGYPTFALKLKNNKTLILLIVNDEIKCRLIKKSKKLSIFQDDQNIEIYSFDSNSINISKYYVAKDGEEISLMSMCCPKQIYNVDRVIKYDQTYLLYNGNYCTEINEDNLFSN